jgi:hypothetical protein
MYFEIFQGIRVTRRVYEKNRLNIAHHIFLSKLIHNILHVKKYTNFGATSVIFNNLPKRKKMPYGQILVTLQGNEKCQKRIYQNLYCNLLLVKNGPRVNVLISRLIYTNMETGSG